MKQIGGENLDRIKQSVQKNISCCRWAMDNDKPVRVLASGQSITAKVKRISWDDMEDVVWFETESGRKFNYTGSRMTTVKAEE